MPSLRREEARIVVGILVIMGFSYVFFISDPPWQTHGSALAYHSILGFLSVVAVASATNRVIMDPTPAHRVFLAATGFLSIVHLGAALIHMMPVTEAVAHTEPKGIFVDIVEMGILGLMLLVAAYLNSEPLKERPLWNKRTTTFGLLVISLGVYGAAAFVSELPALSVFLVGGGISIGFLALVAFVLSCFFAFKRPADSSSHDRKRLIVSYLFFSLSTTILLLVLPFPNSLWLLTIILQAGALIFILFATGYPFLLDVGLQENVAYSFLVALAALVVTPFILAHLVEAWLPVLSYENRPLGLIAHASAAMLSGIAAYILTERLKDKTPWYDGPAIFALLSWTVLESIVVGLRIFQPNDIVIESVLPYLFGGVITSVALLIAIRRTLQPPPEGTAQEHSHVRHVSLLGIMIVTLLVEGTLVMSPSLHTQVQNSPIILALLLVVGYISVLGIIVFGMLRTAQTGGIYSVEIIAVGSLTLWAISQILRVNFSIFTAGWWAAELLLFVVFLFLPPLITQLYVEKYHLEKRLETAAKIYTNLLVDKIDHHHRQSLDSLSGILSHVGLKGKEMEGISRAMTEVSRANDIAQRYDTIVKGGVPDIKETGTIGLHDALQTAFEQVCQIHPHVPKLMLGACSGDCKVWGEKIVVDLFYNLLEGLLTRIHANSISAKIERCTSDMWCATIQIGIESDIQGSLSHLISRYLFQVRESNIEFLLVNEYIRLLGGDVVVVDPKKEDIHNAIIMTVRLPAVNP
ncbi:hypothetical protein EU537_05480 [Candidatus Thorarchaeota archaeon]|nr:MAG: hypothetical protein EU537_05480 [Candidatus Thorarchaeota archaeon]